MLIGKGSAFPRVLLYFAGATPRILGRSPIWIKQLSSGRP